MKSDKLAILHVCTAENDWNDVTTAVVSLAGKWRQLAINLGLSAGVIDSIARDFSNNVDRLNEVILAWLMHKYSYWRRGLPSWSTLSSAVQPINCALAKDLMNRGTVFNNILNHSCPSVCAFIS